MAGPTLSTTSGITDQFQRYFSKQLLDHAKYTLRLAEWGKTTPLPKSAGAKIVSWMRPGEAATTDVQTLSEGTAINTFRTLEMTKIDATLAQYGEVIKLSDILTLTSLYDHMKQAISTLGEDAALHCDTIIRNELCHASTGLGKRYAQGQTSFANLIAQTSANSKLTAQDLLDATTALRVNRAPQAKGGGYVAIVPPQILRDIMLDDAWLNAKQYSDTGDLYKGEVGAFYGVRCIMAHNPFQEDETEGTYASSFSGAGSNTVGLVYTTIVTGKDSYGIPALAGNSPWSPRVIINDKPDKSDPLNQYWLAGWKLYWTAKVLNSAFGVALRSRTGFVA